MNIVDIIKVKYPGQFESGNVSFYYDENDVINISLWTVPNEPQPTNEQLMAWGESNQREVNLYIQSELCGPQIQDLIELTAKNKGFVDAVTCASYINSTNTTWHSDASCFISWRDATWNYAYTLYATLSGNDEPIPSIEEVIAGVPAIVWPN